MIVKTQINYRRTVAVNIISLQRKAHHHLRQSQVPLSAKKVDLEKIVILIKID